MYKPTSNTGEASRVLDSEAICVGKWWRCSSYEVTSGFICPAKDATVTEYNPWVEFEEPIAGKKGGQKLARPYLSFMELTKAFSIGESHGFAHLDPTKWPIITDWCRKFGLPGLFFLEARQVNLYPRWRHLLAEASRWPTCSTHIRTSTGWKTRTAGTFNVNAMTLPNDDKPDGGLVPTEYWAGWEPGVIRQNDQGLIERVAIADFMRPFFPSVPDAEREIYAYPTPLRQEWWKEYSEGVAQFLTAAEDFSRMVRTLASFKLLGQMTEVEKIYNVNARKKLLYLSSQVNPELGLKNDGTFSYDWVCTSLLASFAMMVVLDCARGLLNICGNCDSVFVSSAGRARFCSDRCRRTTMQREWRGRKREL
jgi:hypothetical protein